MKIAKYSQLAKALMFIAMIVLLLSPPALFYSINVSRFLATISNAGYPSSFKLLYSGEPFFEAIKLVERELDQGECTLVLRQAEFAYYQNGCIVNYLDPRLVEFYHAETLELGMELLQKLNIRFIVLPNGYGMSEVTNSQLEAILASAQVSTLIQQTSSFDLYELRKSGEDSVSDIIVDRYRNLGHFKEYNPLFSTKVYYSGAGDYLGPDRAYIRDRTNQEQLVDVSLEISGNGFYKIYTADYRVSEKMSAIAYEDVYMSWRLTEKLLWEGLVNGTRVIKRRTLRAANQSDGFRISVRASSSSSAPKMGTVQVKFGQHSAPYNTKLQVQKKAVESGWNSVSSSDRPPRAWAWGVRDEGDQKVTFMQADRKHDYFISTVNKIKPSTKSVKVTYRYKSNVAHFGAFQWLNQRNPIEGFDASLQKIIDRYFGDENASKADLVEAFDRSYGREITSHWTSRDFDVYRILKTRVFEQASSNLSLDGDQSLCANVVEDSDFVRYAAMLDGSVEYRINDPAWLELKNVTIDEFGTLDCL